MVVVEVNLPTYTNIPGLPAALLELAVAGQVDPQDLNINPSSLKPQSF